MHSIFNKQLIRFTFQTSIPAYEHFKYCMSIENWHTFSANQINYIFGIFDLFQDKNLDFPEIGVKNGPDIEIHLVLYGNVQIWDLT